MTTKARVVTFDLPGRPTPDMEVIENNSQLNSTNSYSSEDKEEAKSILNELRNTDRVYINDLSDLRTRLEPTDSLCGVVDLLRECHIRIPDVINGLPNWINQVANYYNRYTKLYKYSLEDTDQLAYLKKRPLSRLSYLAKALNNIESHHTSSIGAGLIQDLANHSQTKLTEELENADLNTFIFSKACNFDTLQPVSATFNPSQIVLRDCFEMDLFHSKLNKTKISVEVFLLVHREKTDLAICSLEYPGRALMFPSFRQGEIVYNEKIQQLENITLNCCYCSNPKQIVLYSSDQTTIKSWKWKLSQLFSREYVHSNSSSNSSLETNALGISFDNSINQSLLPLPTPTSIKRLTVPLTPSLVDQLKEFLEPDFNGNDIITIESKPSQKPSNRIPSSSANDERIKRAQLARKEIEKEMFQKEQKLIQFRRDSESGLLTPKGTPPKGDRKIQRKPVPAKHINSQIYGLDSVLSDKVSSVTSVNTLIQTSTPKPPNVPLPTPTGEKRRLVLSPSDENSIVSNEKRPLLATSREPSPVEEEKEAVRARNMLQSRGSPRIKVGPRVVNSMYVLKSDDEANKENINPSLPRSNSDGENINSFQHNVSSPLIERVSTEEFHLASPRIPLSTPPSKFSFVRKVSGGLKKMMKKKSSKIQFDILNLTPPFDQNEEFEGESSIIKEVDIVDHSMGNADEVEDSENVKGTSNADDSINEDINKVHIDSTSDTDTIDESEEEEEVEEISNSKFIPAPTAVYQNSNNSTVEKGSLSNISLRSLPRSNQSSSNSIQVDKAPDCSIQEFWNRKKQENSSIRLFQGHSLILNWQSGNWVSLNDSKEYLIQVNINGEGAVIVGKPTDRKNPSANFELILLSSHEIRRSTMHDIQIKSPTGTTMFRIRDIEEAEKFWTAIRKDFKNQPLVSLQGNVSGPPSLNDKDSSLGSLSSAVTNANHMQYQYTLVPPMISKSGPSTPTGGEFPTPPLSISSMNNSQVSITDNSELLLLNNLRCRLIQKGDNGWQSEGEVARLSVFSVSTSTSKTVLVRGVSNLPEPFIYEKNMKASAFARIGKVGISVCLVGQTELEVTNLLQFKGEKEATYVYELLTSN